jgi:hypothetical protein
MVKRARAFVGEAMPAGRIPGRQPSLSGAKPYASFQTLPD